MFWWVFEFKKAKIQLTLNQPNQNDQPRHTIMVIPFQPLISSNPRDHQSFDTKFKSFWTHVSKEYRAFTDEFAQEIEDL